MKKAKVHVRLLTFILLIVIIFLTKGNFPGDTLLYFVFGLVSLTMIFLILVNPRSYIYTFMAVFLFLGFWAKLVAHQFIDYPFIEPIGCFLGTYREWNEVLLVSISGMVGLIIARLIYIFMIKTRNEIHISKLSVPTWYSKNKNWIWIVSLLLISIFNIFNLFFAFYQVGTSPKILLHFPINIIVSWIINYGFTIWLSCLLYWEKKEKGFLSNKYIFVVVLEATISSISTLSRSMFLFKTLPYLLLIMERKIKLNIKQLVTIVLLCTVLFVGSLASVTLLRANLFYSNTAINEQVVDKVEGNTLENTDSINSKIESNENKIISTELKLNNYDTAFRELLFLTVDRWIGLEGIMSIVNEETSFNLFLRGIKEDPNLGVNSIYQKMSNSHYEESKEFTFLTIPGIFSVLYYSGSKIFILIMMVVLTLLLQYFEFLVTIFIRNKFLVSIVGLAVANMICQTNYPYLTFVFFVELIFTLFIIYLIQGIIINKSKLERT